MGLRAASSDEVTAQQSLRTRRFALGAVISFLTSGLLGLAYALGHISAGAALLMFGATAGVNAAIYLLFRTGVNLRFADPSLTKVQTMAAVGLLMLAVYLLDEGRPLALMLCLLIFLFGVFRLSTREFITLTLFTLACYAAVINLLMHLRPQAIQDVHLEWSSWAVLAAVLPCFSVVAGKISAMRERLRGSNRELSDALATIQNIATRDDVTGLYNRAFFTESLRGALARGLRHERPLALFVIGADRFTLINDSLGPAGGDQVLREIGARTAAAVRDSDIVARFGGDEFVVLIEDCGSRLDVSGVAEKVLASVARPFAVGGRELSLSASIGAAIAPGDGRDEQTLLRNAEFALHKAKKQGRGGIRLYAEGMRGRNDERLELEARLPHAAERGELRLHYQPKVALGSGRITGVEALVRWQHPRLGLLGPDRFIGLAEETGAIVPIGRWVLRTACARASAWRREYGLDLRMAVNLSRRQFADRTLRTDIAAALDEAGLDPGRLELEITESTVMHRAEHAAAQMRELRAIGVHLAMDDFGTGYSSLGFLKRFPISNVKIDRSFMRDLPHSGGDAAITRAVIGMAHSLHLTVTAEGVENREQVEFLRRERCEEYQGYFCSPPVPESELLRLVVARAATN